MKSYQCCVSGWRHGPGCDKLRSSRSRHRIDTSEDEGDIDDKCDRSLSLPDTNTHVKYINIETANKLVLNRHEWRRGQYWRQVWQMAVLAWHKYTHVKYINIETVNKLVLNRHEWRRGRYCHEWRQRQYWHKWRRGRYWWHVWQIAVFAWHKCSAQMSNIST